MIILSKSFIDLKNKNVVITGGNKGIGQKIAIDFAELGANVIIIGRDNNALNQTLDILNRYDGNHNAFSLDITKLNKVSETVEQIIAIYKSIDILVNNAGINISKPAFEIEEEDWDKVLELNLKSLFFISKFFGRYMAEEEGGKIINVASQVGFVGYHNRAPYSSSKGGVIQLTKSLAIEWAKYNINVNAIAPTFVETKLTEEMFKDKKFKEDVLNRVLFHKLPKLDDITGAILYLSSNLSNFITGETIKIDGGWTAI
ncbi:SDR family oxidoreductase [Staphylococcus nepalensis]|uniref:SDR family NAD(P)-dependent oxidoreductase n=1 Tax=Staphylococcus nepalensis TaxID=214473 RepID=UPI003511565A